MTVPVLRQNHATPAWNVLNGVTGSSGQHVQQRADMAQKEERVCVPVDTAQETHINKVIVKTNRAHTGPIGKHGLLARYLVEEVSK